MPAQVVPAKPKHTRTVREVQKPLLEQAAPRFWGKINKTDTCWLWRGYINHYGYGWFWFNGRLWPAHRFAYFLLREPVPPNLCLDHLCRVRSCVNPWHLEAVTLRENILRGTAPSARAARVTHCPKEHPYDSANTIHYKGRRMCRRCHSNHVNARRRRIRAAKRTKEQP